MEAPALDHRRLLELAGDLDAAADPMGRTVAPGVAALLQASGDVLLHLDAEMRRLLPPLERAGAAWAQVLAEDLLVDHVVLRTALLALRERTARGAAVGGAARAVAEGLRRHVQVFESVVARLEPKRPAAAPSTGRPPRPASGSGAPGASAPPPASNAPNAPNAPAP